MCGYKWYRICDGCSCEAVGGVGCGMCNVMSDDVSWEQQRASQSLLQYSQIHSSTELPVFPAHNTNALPRVYQT